jgi:hypothetical protein
VSVNASTSPAETVLSRVSLHGGAAAEGALVTLTVRPMFDSNLLSPAAIGLTPALSAGMRRIPGLVPVSIDGYTRPIESRPEARAYVLSWVGYMGSDAGVAMCIYPADWSRSRIWFLIASKEGRPGSVTVRHGLIPSSSGFRHCCEQRVHALHRFSAPGTRGSLQFDEADAGSAVDAVLERIRRRVAQLPTVAELNPFRFQERAG